MKKFEILEHKADFKIRAFGKDKEQLFENALLAMESGFRAETEEGARETRNIKIQSPELSALLVDFLSEVLYLIQTNKEIYSVIKFKKLTEKNLEAELSGQKVKYFSQEIKGVTYHNLEIKNEEGGWQATILFDA